MSKFIVIIIGVLIIMGAAMSGFLSSQRTGGREAAPAPSCYDYEPQNSPKSEVYNGISYKLIKEQAPIARGKVDNEMKLVATSVNGRELYILEGKTMDGLTLEGFIFIKVPDIEIIKGNNKKGSLVFDIYIQDGVPIPDYIKNCKSKGGKIGISSVGAQQFPPSAFNSSQIIRPVRTLVEPAWLFLEKYSQGAAGVQALANPSAELIGYLSTPKGEMPLYYHSAMLFLVDGQDAYSFGESDQVLELGANDKKSLQLQKFEFINTVTVSWWTPDCKPAIYLYPTKEIDARVQVFPQGRLALTIPPYPRDGWFVRASPDGKILSDNKTYPYLYYESEINDEYVTKPTTGYVVSFSNIPSLFSSLLPKLGLNKSETADFKEYWEKTLPFASYYFVGVMDQDTINKIEPLVITPKPDTSIRVRLYFEALNQLTPVQPPSIQTPTKSSLPCPACRQAGGRQGFTMVEWGGMVKTDINHPFTCSQ